MSWLASPPFLLSPILASGGGEEDLGSQALNHINPHPFTWIDTPFGEYTLWNHVIMLLVSAALLTFLIPIFAKPRGIVPKGFRNLIEAVLQFLREDMARPVLGHLTDKFIPFIWTMFFLILTANLLGMIPLGSIWGAFGLWEHEVVHAGVTHHPWHHMAGTATGNIAITAGLALCALFFIHVNAIKEQGIVEYMKQYLGHAPIWLCILMIPLEIVSALVKPFALAMRLFANMIAGHVVIAVLLIFAASGLMAGGMALGISAVSILGAVFINLLELLVAFLQAYIFTFLTTLFVGMAAVSDH